MAESFKHKQFSLTTTTTTLYTCPANTSSIIFMMQVANKDLNAATGVTVQVSDTSANTTKYLASQIPIPAKSAATLITGKLVLEAEDSLLGTATANGQLDLMLSILEIA